MATIVLFFFLAVQLSAQPQNPTPSEASDGARAVAYSPPSGELEGASFFLWGLQAGSAENDLVTGIVAVKNDVLVTGSFKGEFQCGNKKVTGNGSYDMFLMKTNTDGKPEWIRSLGGEGADYGNCITADEEQVCVGGLVYGPVQFEKQTFGGEGAAIMVSSWDLDGKLNWLSRLPYSATATVDVVQLLPDGSVLAGGQFQGTVTTDAGQLKSPNRRLAWQAIFSPGGKLEKISQSSGTGVHRLRAASVDREGNLYLLHGTTGSLDVGDGQSLPVTRGTKAALALQKRDKDGRFLWGQVFESTGYLDDAGLAVGTGGEVQVCLNFNKEFRTRDTLITCQSQLKTVLLSLDRDGETRWVRTVSSRVNSHAVDVLADAVGNTLITGAFREDFSTDGMTFESGESNSNLFLLRFDRDGKLAWHDAPAWDATNVGMAFTLDEMGNIVLAGLFRETISLQGEPMQTYGEKDIFLAKYFNCGQVEVKVSGDRPLCEGGSCMLYATGGFETYLWNSAERAGPNYEARKPGKYWVTAYTKQGCQASDTVLVFPAETADLGLEPVVTLYPGNEKTLTAREGFLSYAWNDGVLGRQREVSFVKGQDSQLLVLSAQTEDGCTVTDSVAVRYASTADNGLVPKQGLKVYPNPVDEYLWWTMDIVSDKPLVISLTDSKSTLVMRQEVKDYLPGIQRQLDVKNFPPGNYLFTVQAGELVFTEKVIKK